MMLVLWLSEGG